MGSYKWSISRPAIVITTLEILRALLINTVDDINPASPNTYYATRIPTGLVQKIMEDSHFMTNPRPTGTARDSKEIGTKGRLI